MTGCRPNIGDACGSATDCSSQGDRLCDITQPDGYCTIFYCEPDTCPSEAACVAFNLSLDPACGSLDDSRWGRFARSFCMYVCEDDSDCRDGYACQRPIDRLASVVDTETDTSDPQDTKVCLAIATLPALPDGAPGTCTPRDAGTDLVPWTPDAGTGGTAGAGGGSAGAGGT
jgi:hypothetical protein